MCTSSQRDSEDIKCASKNITEDASSTVWFHVG